MPKQKFISTGGPAIAERNSASNLFHIEQTGHNEGVAFFWIKPGESAREYKITAKPGASQRAVTDAFRKFNADVAKKGSSVGQLYWKHFRGNQLLNIKPVAEHGKAK